MQNDTNILNFYPPKSCFRILISYLELTFNFYNLNFHFLEIFHTDLDSKFFCYCFFNKKLKTPRENLDYFLLDPVSKINYRVRYFHV